MPAFDQVRRGVEGLVQRSRSSPIRTQAPRQTPAPLCGARGGGACVGGTLVLPTSILPSGGACWGQSDRAPGTACPLPPGGAGVYSRALCGFSAEEVLCTRQRLNPPHPASAPDPGPAGPERAATVWPARQKAGALPKGKNLPH